MVVAGCAQLPGADIGAGGADAAQDVTYGAADGALVGKDHRLALAGAVLGHAAYSSSISQCLYVRVQLLI